MLALHVYCLSVDIYITNLKALFDYLLFIHLLILSFQFCFLVYQSKPFQEDNF